MSPFLSVVCPLVLGSLVLGAARPSRAVPPLPIATAAVAATPGTSLPAARVRHYRLTIQSVRPSTWTSARGVAARAAQASFSIRTLATGARTRFEITTGLDGDLAGVPLMVRWQPRWWLEIGLHLAE
jgi:hypothetical protein